MPDKTWVEHLLEREERTAGNTCHLIRFWETDLPDGGYIQLLVYEHEYFQVPEAGRTQRIAVYKNGRHIMGAIL